MTTHLQHWKNQRKLHRLHQRLHPMEEKKPYRLVSFVKEFWYIVIGGPLFFTAVITSLALLGVDAGKPWAVVISATVTICTMLSGGWIRNQWLLSSGKWKKDTTKYEPDGSVHSPVVMDKGQDEGKFRDKWGNRLFTEQQVIDFAHYIRGDDMPIKLFDLNIWIKANKIP